MSAHESHEAHGTASHESHGEGHKQEKKPLELARERLGLTEEQEHTIEHLLKEYQLEVNEKNVAKLVGDLERHLNVQSNVLVRKDFALKRTELAQDETASWWKRSKQWVKNYAYQLSETFHTGFGTGKGFHDDVAKKKKELVSEPEYVSSMARGAIHQESVRKNYNEFTKNRPELKKVLERYTVNTITYDELITDADYKAGVEDIKNDLRTRTGEFWLANHKYNLDDANEKAHVIYEVETSLPQWAQLNKMEVLSSNDYLNQSTLLSKVGRLATSPIAWSTAAHYAAEAALAGTVVASTGGLIAVGAGVGAVAAAGREYAKGKQRTAQRRVDRAVSQVEHSSERSFVRSNTELITALQHDMAAAKAEHANKPELEQLLQNLTDAQVRLQQSQDQKQDFIGFGISNRFAEQAALLKIISEASGIAKKLQLALPMSDADYLILLRAKTLQARAVINQAQAESSSQENAQELKTKSVGVVIGAVWGSAAPFAIDSALDASWIASKTWAASHHLFEFSMKPNLAPDQAFHFSYGGAADMTATLTDAKQVVLKLGDSTIPVDLSHFANLNPHNAHAEFDSFRNELQLFDSTSSKLVATVHIDAIPQPLHSASAIGLKAAEGFAAATVIKSGTAFEGLLEKNIRSTAGRVGAEYGAAATNTGAAPASHH